jgi:glycosyltransferase involved in cell wall biosynthesis
MPARPAQEASGSARGPIPVAFVTDLLSVGGAESQLISLVHALDPARIRAEVAVLRGEGAQMDRLRVPGRAFGMRGPGDMRMIPALASYLRRGRFRAIYTTHLWSVVLATTIKPWVRPPAPQRRWVILASEHSYRAATASRPTLVTARRWALQRVDRIIAVAQAQAAWLREYYGPAAAPIEVIPNGLDPGAYAELHVGDADLMMRAADSAPGGTEATPAKAIRAELGIPPRAPLAVCVARLVPVKNLDVLLAAMESPALRELGVHLALVGDGPLRDELARIAEKPALEGRVHLAGRRADTKPFLAAAQVACLSSSSEAQPMALLEAMAAGLPVVATRVGGIPEMVEDGVTGLLVEPGDAGALAQALAQALADPEWSRRAGDSGRRRVEQVFSIHARARRIEELIEGLVEEACDR